MEKPIRNDYVEMDEDSSGNLRGCLDEDAYIDALEKYIDYLELQLKNLPNELRAVNRNEAAKEVCLFCGKEIENPKVLTVCNKCLDEYYSKQTG